MEEESLSGRVFETDGKGPSLDSEPDCSGGKGTPGAGTLTTVLLVGAEAPPEGVCPAAGWKETDSAFGAFSKEPADPPQIPNFLKTDDQSITTECRDFEILEPPLSQRWDCSEGLAEKVLGEYLCSISRKGEKGNRLAGLVGKPTFAEEHGPAAGRPGVAADGEAVGVGSTGNGHEFVQEDPIYLRVARSAHDAARF